MTEQYSNTKAIKVPKIMISAGESSGDNHGAALIEAARNRGYGWNVLGLGGERLKEQDMRLIAHIKDTSVMGLTEVLGSLSRILSVRRRMLTALELERPDVLILIDSPDFNFALAKKAYQLSIPVVYYICPQVWAWRKGRLKFLQEYTNRRALLFEFEKKFYEDHGVSADWVGHPILDELPNKLPKDEAKRNLGLDAEKKLLALMPGSRKKVVEALASTMFQAADLVLQNNPDVELVLPLADTIDPEYMESFIEDASALVRSKIRIIPGRSREILMAADAALVASGTSSVEAAVIGTPTVVTYRVNPCTWTIGKALVSPPHPYVSIANLMTGREVVPEYLQNRCTAENLSSAIIPLLNDSPERQHMLEELQQVRTMLGPPGASGRVADIVAEIICEKQRGGL